MGTDGTRRERIDWAAAPMVPVIRPTCWRCDSLHYRKVKTLEAETDGSQTRLVRCADCGAAYKVCLEIPESGNHIWPVS